MTRMTLIRLTAAALLLCCATVARAQDTVDPPQRVARLAYATGDVEFAPASSDQWGVASRNRPLISGDRLLTGDDGRAALELGNAAARIDAYSAFSFLRLDQQIVQIQLSQGTINLRARQIYGDQVYEIDTPTLAFVASQPGSYRIDVDPDGYGAMVTVFEGSGIVYGANNAQRSVGADHTYRFDDEELRTVHVRGIPRGDDFDQFCFERDARHAQSESRRYVSANVVGYQDLDRYGDWRTSRDYGEVWYPRNVSASWAPYRDGRWVWVEPWGWTWVDNAPWGFAPFHYGRWAYIGQRWAWVPGPRQRRAVYAPALVAFIGGPGFSLSIGSVAPVGWFPLGPSDIYLPPYRVSQRYFTTINVTNIRLVTDTRINHFYTDYHRHHRAWRNDYAYRRAAHAITVVPRDVFTGAEPVARGALRVKHKALAANAVALRPAATPRVASLGVMPRGRPTALPVAAFQREVIARHTPAPRSAPFADRVKLIAQHDGAPLTMTQRNALQQRHTGAAPRVKVLDVATSSTPRGRPATRHQPIPVPATMISHQRAPTVAPQRPVARPLPRSVPRVQPRSQASPTPRRVRADRTIRPRIQSQPWPRAQPSRETRSTPMRAHAPSRSAPRAQPRRAQPAAPTPGQHRVVTHRVAPRGAPTVHASRAVRRPAPQSRSSAQAPARHASSPRGRPAPAHLNVKPRTDKHASSHRRFATH